MTIRKATINDMETLVKLRVDFLRNNSNLDCLDNEELLKLKLRDYYRKWLPGGGFVAFIAEDGDAVYSTAFLSVAERPPRDADASCLVGTVYNVFTYPQYRRKGMATKVMNTLLEEAKALGLAAVELMATDDGKPLYEKLGFTPSKHTSMRLKLSCR